MLLTTGNKSEMSVGYATLYGDMNGGFAPLKDVPKLWVYRLSCWRNRIDPEQGEVIPARVIERSTKMGHHRWAETCSSMGNRLANGSQGLSRSTSSPCTSSRQAVP